MGCYSQPPSKRALSSNLHQGCPAVHKREREYGGLYDGEWTVCGITGFLCGIQGVICRVLFRTGPYEDGEGVTEKRREQRVHTE